MAYDSNTSRTLLAPTALADEIVPGTERDGLASKAVKRLIEIQFWEFPLWQFGY